MKLEGERASSSRSWSSINERVLKLYALVCYQRMNEKRVVTKNCECETEETEKRQKPRHC